MKQEDTLTRQGFPSTKNINQGTSHPLPKIKAKNQPILIK